jgi:hypothetical protein
VTSLRPNLVKRIERLPKPTNVANALQPLFEPVSNAIHSTQARFFDNVARDGRVVTVSTDRKKENVWAIVEDNGLGLDEMNWDAFATTDTDNKIRIGGKGVGRLLWLDCFEQIKINSVFKDGEEYKRRAFRFVLASENQIQELKIEDANGASSSSFQVRFEGLRSNGYHDKFPGRGNFIFQHITSHFLPIFIGGRCPQITVDVSDETRNDPAAIDDILHQRDPELVLETQEYGGLKLTLMECDKVASADLKGSHFVHFIAHDRTVHSQSIDGKLGLIMRYFGDEGDRVFPDWPDFVSERLDLNLWSCTTCGGRFETAAWTPENDRERLGADVSAALGGVNQTQYRNRFSHGRQRGILPFSRSLHR